MPQDRQFAWTGILPAAGYVGYVNIAITDEGVCFSVRREGSGESAAYTVPHDVAAQLLKDAADALAG